VSLPELHTGNIQVVSCKATPELKAYTVALAERADLVRRRLVLPEDDNLLKITSDGRKASLFNGPPGTWPEAPTKLNHCAERVWRHYCQGDADLGTQLIFCDLYTPKEADTGDDEYLHATLTNDEKFEAHGIYGRLKTLLVARGILPSEIVFAHDFDSAKDRAKLHAMIRSGAVRVCIGSTALIGLAVNVQDRLLALHNLDCPWRPDELEQRIKRMVRQGNRYDVVHGYVYVTEGSYDPVVWQIVEQKARWISQLLSGRVGRKVVEDIGSVVLTASLAKAVALGDTRVLDKTRLETELGGFERRWLSWAQGRAALRRDVERIPGEIANLRRQAEHFALFAKVGQWGEGLRLVDPTLSGTELRDVSTVQDGNALVRALWLRYVARQQSVVIGFWRGFRLWLEPHHGTLELAAYPPAMSADGNGLTVSGLGFQASRPVTELAQRLTEEQLGFEVRQIEKRIASLEARHSAITTELTECWPLRSNVEKLLKQYDALCADSGDGALPDKITFKFRWE